MVAANDSPPPLPRAACQSAASLARLDLTPTIPSHGDIYNESVSSHISYFPCVGWAGNKCVRVTVAPAPLRTSVFCHSHCYALYLKVYL